MPHPEPTSQTVLVAILNNRRDLDILLRERWYRIPATRMPVRRFGWVAFYQTSAFGPEGRAIRYYARVQERERLQRRELLPGEPDHPRAGEEYVRLRFRKIRTLGHAIRNRTSMRLTFGFTTLARLERFRSLHSLFGVRPLEAIFKRLLRHSGIPADGEHPIRSRRRVRYRLDFAVFCKKGRVAIECDQRKHHAGRRRDYDRRRDRFLRRREWLVLRFSDEDILREPDRCIDLLRQAIRRLGGFADEPRC